MATRRPRKSDTASDGRVRRGQRSGDAIVNAVVELVGGGVLEPSAQQVAEHARVGIRTVFRRFSAMESLFTEVDGRLHSEALPLLAGGEPSGSIETRAREMVERRAKFFERIAPYKRAGNLKRWRSPFLRERHARLVRGLRTDLLRWLPELRSARLALVDGLELATSFEAWDRLRSEQRLSCQRARVSVETTVLLLVREITKPSGGRGNA